MAKAVQALCSAPCTLGPMSVLRKYPSTQWHSVCCITLANSVLAWHSSTCAYKSRVAWPISVSLCGIPFTSCSCEHFLSRTHTPQPLTLLQLPYNLSRDLPVLQAYILCTYTDPILPRFGVVILSFCSGGFVFFLLSVFASTSISFTPSSLSATPKSQCCDITPHIQRTPCLPHSYDRGSRASLLFILLHHTRQPRSSGAFCAKMEALHPPSQMTI